MSDYMAVQVLVCKGESFCPQLTKTGHLLPYIIFLNMQIVVLWPNVRVDASTKWISRDYL